MDSLSPKQVNDIKNLYESIYKVDEVEERDYISELFDSEEFDSLSDELKENIIKKFQDKLAGSERAGVFGQIERLRRKAFGSKKESDQAREYEKNVNKKNKENILKQKEKNNNTNKVTTTDNNLSNKDKSDIKKEVDLQKVLDNKKQLQKIETDNKNKNKIDTSNKNKIKSEYPTVDQKTLDAKVGEIKKAGGVSSYIQNLKDKTKDTSSEIESDANYEKSNLRFNRASKGLPPVKRPRVPSPMDMLNPGGAKVKARFKAREAQGLSGLTGKPKFEAYDVVLDYVLSEGHADTVKEAHYVMMQMDAETIQDIVERVILTEKPGDGYIGPKFLNIKNPIAKQRTNFQLDQNLKRLSKTGDSPEARDMLNIPQDFKITPEMKTKYGF